MKTIQAIRDQVLIEKHGVNKYNDWDDFIDDATLTEILELNDKAWEEYAAQYKNQRQPIEKALESSPTEQPEAQKELTEDELKALSSVGIIAKNWYAVTYNENQTPFAMFDNEQYAKVYRDQFCATAVIVPYPMQIKDYRKQQNQPQPERVIKAIDQMIEKDLKIWGMAYKRKHPNGLIERIPPDEMVRITEPQPEKELPEKELNEIAYKRFKTDYKYIGSDYAKVCVLEQYIKTRKHHD